MKIEIYANGLVHCSVCAPNEMTTEQIEEEVNAKNPTGVSSKWKKDSALTFSDGGAHPRPCEHDPKRTHYLMVC